MGLEMGVMDDLVTHAEKRVEELKANTPEGVQKRLDSMKPSKKPGKFHKAISKSKGTISVIPQLKYKMPHKGTINEAPPQSDIISAHCYEAKAAAMGVCIDSDNYGYGLEDLKAAAKQQASYKGEFPSPLPVLAFDTFIDPIQLALAAGNGAVGCNLYVAALKDRTAEMIEAANGLGMDAIVQVHNKEELDQALEAGAKIIGVTNRNPDTWEPQNVVCGVTREWVEPFEDTVFSLLKDIPEDITSVAMGHVNETLVAWTLRDEGYNAVMVGEAIMRGVETAQVTGNSYQAAYNEAKGIIMAYRSKGSKKYGPSSTAQFYGKGEGAKEELGMISM